MLQEKANYRNSYPTPKAHKDWFPSALYQFYDVCIKADGCHRQNYKKFA
jgi:hypothetical protein